MKNPCGRTVTPENAYEVWQSDNGFTYYVLKKYRHPKYDDEPYTRWFCFTTSPFVPEGESGEAYANQIKADARIVDNPLHHVFCVKGLVLDEMETFGLSAYPAKSMEEYDPRLRSYLKISVLQRMERKSNDCLKSMVSRSFASMIPILLRCAFLTYGQQKDRMKHIRR